MDGMGGAGSREMNVHSILVGYLEGKISFGRPRRRWEFILDSNLKRYGRRF
jgi:hypothetical protein